MRRLAILSLVSFLALPVVALAAEDGHAARVELPVWSAVPFVALLLCIALLPLAAGHFWHKNRNKLFVSVVLSIPVILYLVSLRHQADGHTVHALLHGLEEYVGFILLLGALYTISGGIVVEGNLVGKPTTNATLLLIGAVIANFIGTTGASMLLIRPYLRMNAHRRFRSHLPIFFIFIVSNVGGLLTPLGDPPLFLGYLKGIDFFWTLRLWRHWLVVNGSALMIFFVWDSISYLREGLEVKQIKLAATRGIKLRGLINFLFLAGVMGAVLVKSRLPDVWKERFVSEGLMLFMAILSLIFTPRGLRTANEFGWGPIVEVAVLFIGIFVTMVPALELLKVHGPDFPLHQPWHYFWLTGSLSAFLDNAPTYVTFGAIAAGPNSFKILMSEPKEMILVAISCGAVFMGAMTYIGNGPNFMVKAITEESGVKMPSFFGYLAYSCLILLPLFVGVTFLFFSPTS